MNRDALHAAIAHGESLLAKLQADQTEATQRLAALRAELAAFEAEGEIPVRLPLALGTPTPWT